MKIAHFNTSDNGGAGKAAYRLSTALNRIGEESNLFVKHKSIAADDVIEINSPEVNNRLFDMLSNKYFYTNIKKGNTISSIMYPSIGFNFLDELNKYDVFNLHWISSFISIEAIVKMYEMNKPIVWTLHDQNPMTGACHYTHGCEKYKTDCSECPQLVENKFNITKSILEIKKKYFSPEKITIVTPSKWLAECAERSTVFENYRIEVIPNSIETDIYRPYDKIEIKKGLGFSENVKIILFGAHDLNENRKGLPELLESVQILKANEYFNKLLQKNEIFVLSFGASSNLLDNMQIPYKTLGYIHDDSELAKIYSAADVLTLPSLEDNLPNLMLESMACGTPVVSFATGGMKSTIINGKNGYVSPLGDLRQFAENIIKVLQGSNMSQFCRQFALDNFNMQNQAAKYQELYTDLLNKFKNNQVLISDNVPKIFPELAHNMQHYICDISKEIEEDYNKLLTEKEHLLKEKNELLIERNNLQSELECIYKSKSWKVTKPIRKFFHIVNQLKQK